jgi:hypothetical protein
MDRIQEADENNKNSVVALAIKGNKKSKYVVQWALDKFVHEGISIFKLIHVRAVINGVPTPSKIYLMCDYVIIFNKVTVLCIQNFQIFYNYIRKG